MMIKTHRTAIAAAADEGVRRALPALLAGANLTLEAMEGDGRAALERARNCRADVVIADVHLPVMDGPALAGCILTESGFARRPKVMLLCRREFPVSGRAKLESSGVLFLDWPAGQDAFSEAVESLLDRMDFCPERVNRAEKLLDELGVPVHAGRECLKFAALICADDDRMLHRRDSALYPLLGKMLAIDSAGVERALRHAIGAAWQSDKFENQYRIFADTVDARRGQPTCGEMIARLADILRLEG